MLTLALLLVFPLVWPFVAKVVWKHEITFAELGANVVIGVVVVVLGWYGGRHIQMLDYEIINGQVVSKASHRVSCEHSYRCNCRETCSGTGQNRSCSETCDTCYEHGYDIDWRLATTVGDVTIRRVDRQGVKEPPRFSQARTGDPVAQSHAFTNYVKAAPDSLFNTAVEKSALTQFSSLVPTYPGEVYDYHYVDRVIAQGVTVPDLPGWNRELALMLRGLGPTKQVNAVIVFTSQKDPQYATALRAAWLGGKKNDVIVVIGTPAFPAIEWVRVVSWTDQELFKVELRDEIAALKTVERPTVLKALETRIGTQFVRKQMKDFEYLQDDIVPPGWLLAVLALLSVGSSVGASVYFARNSHSARRAGYSSARRFSHWSR